MVLCGIRGYGDEQLIELIEEFSSFLNKNFSPTSYQRIMNQYQQSLVDKKIYSRVRDKWFIIKLNENNCKEGRTTTRILMAHMRGLSK